MISVISCVIYALVIEQFRTQYDQYFAGLFIPRAFRRVKLHQNMRNEGNIGQIVREKRAMTSLSVMYKISTICKVIIYQGKYESTEMKIYF